MNTTMILLLGACGVTVLVLVGVVVNSPDPSQPQRPRGYKPAHRGGPVAWKPDVEAPLPPARALEEQLVRFPVGHPEQAQPVVFEERTEEQPVIEPVNEPAVQPVVHHGADEEWSPKDELPAAGALDPERAEQRRAAGRHRRLARAVSPDRQADRHIAAARTELDAKLAPLLQRIERAGHEDTDTWQWTAEEFAAIRARAGAR